MTKQQDGFTLIELMIATVIFSVILLATTTMLFQVGRLYYKGVITNRTQSTARTLADSLAQQIQFGGDRVTFGTSRSYGTPAATVEAFCIGTQRYSYVINGKVSSGAPEGQYTAQHEIQHGLWQDTISPGGACEPLNLTLANPGGTSGKELLGQNMRLTSAFRLSPTNCNDVSVCTVSVGVIYGDDDLLSPNATNPSGCGNVTGSQWCATSNLYTKVYKRIKQAGI